MYICIYSLHNVYTETRVLDQNSSGPSRSSQTPGVLGVHRRAPRGAPGTPVPGAAPAGVRRARAWLTRAAEPGAAGAGRSRRVPQVVARCGARRRGAHAINFGVV